MLCSKADSDMVRCPNLLLNIFYRVKDQDKKHNSYMYSYLDKFDKILKVFLIIDCHQILVVPPYPIVLHLVVIAVGRGQRTGQRVLYTILAHTELVGWCDSSRTHLTHSV